MSNGDRGTDRDKKGQVSRLVGGQTGTPFYKKCPVLSPSPTIPVKR